MKEQTPHKTDVMAYKKETGIIQYLKRASSHDVLVQSMQQLCIKFLARKVLYTQ